MYLVTSSGVGGAERQVHDLSVRLDERGWDVTAVSMLPLESSLADLPAAGIATVSLGMVPTRPDPRAFLRFGMLLRDLRPDVLHAHMVHANLLARLSRLVRPRTPVVVSTMHNQYQGARWRMVAYRVTDFLGDATTAVSDAATNEAIRQGAVSPDRIFTLPNGIDVSRYAADDRASQHLRQELSLGDDFVWLAVGRLTKAKDYPNLIDAVGLLSRTHDAFQVLIAGSGPDEQAIRSRISADGLADRVRVLGVRSDIPDLMRAADAFVMSSAWEGLPIVLLEAAASSLPIVATDVGGNREVVADGVSGFLVPSGDPGALAGRMRQVLDLDPVHRLAMGDAGLGVVSSGFDLDVIARRWSTLYSELLHRRRRAWITSSK